MKIKYRVLLILCVFFIAPSCTSKSSTIFDQSVCNAPCWGGVTPGITNKDDGVGSISEVPYITRGSLDILDTENGEGLIVWQFNLSVPEKNGIAYFENGEIYLINLELKRKIPVSRFIEEFGVPNVIIPYSCWAETKWEHIVLLYTDIGLALTSFDPWIRPGRSFTEIKHNFKVEEVFYYEPSSFFDPGVFFRVSDAPLPEEIQENLQEWRGYGMYNYIECE